jgi:hypothetical protein
MNSLDALLQKIVQAARPGGIQVNTLFIQVQVTEPEFVVAVHYHAMRPQRTRAEVKMDGKTVFLEAYDGQRAWQVQGDGEPFIASPEGRDALRRGAFHNLYSINELPAQGHVLELLEPTDFDGRAFPTLRIIFDDGHQVHHYFDPDTLLLARKRDHHALHPDLDDAILWTESRHTDYREVDGMLQAFHEETINLKTGEMVQSTQVQAIEINPKLNATLFEMPDAN